MKNGHHEEARAAYRHYLRLAPVAGTKPKHGPRCACP